MTTDEIKECTRHIELTASIFIWFIFAIRFVIAEQFFGDTITIAASKLVFGITNRLICFQTWQHFTWFYKNRKIETKKQRKRQKWINVIWSKILFDCCMIECFLLILDMWNDCVVKNINNEEQNEIEILTTRNNFIQRKCMQKIKWK